SWRVAAVSRSWRGPTNSTASSSSSSRHSSRASPVSRQPNITKRPRFVAVAPAKSRPSSSKEATPRPQQRKLTAGEPSRPHALRTECKKPLKLGRNGDERGHDPRYGLSGRARYYDRRACRVGGAGIGSIGRADPHRFWHGTDRTARAERQVGLAGHEDLGRGH